MKKIVIVLIMMVISVSSSYASQCIYWNYGTQKHIFNCNIKAVPQSLQGVYKLYEQTVFHNVNGFPMNKTTEYNGQMWGSVVKDKCGIHDGTKINTFEFERGFYSNEMNYGGKVGFLAILYWKDGFVWVIASDNPKDALKHVLIYSSKVNYEELNRPLFGIDVIITTFDQWKKENNLK